MYNRVPPMALVAIAAAVAGPSAQAQQQSPTFEFRAADAVKWIPMADSSVRGIVVPIIVNGKSVKAFIDTGSTGNVALSITAHLQQEFALKPVSSLAGEAYGGRVRSDVVTLSSVQIGGLRLGNQQADVTPDFGDVDVVIGERLLLAMLLQVDWTNRRVRFLLPGDMAPTADDVATLIDHRTHFLVVPTTLCGAEHPFVLDTGLEDPPTINSWR